MSKYSYKSVYFVTFVTMILFCTPPQANPSNPSYSPVYMSYADLRSSFNFGASQSVKKAGKIYVYGSYVFINEINRGIHVIDRTIPASPQNVGFINIPGNVDMAIKNNILYADSYVDLVAIDITNPAAPVEVSRLTDVFPYPYYFSDAMAEPYITLNPNAVFGAIDTAMGIVVGWLYQGEVAVAQVASACAGSGGMPAEMASSGGGVASGGTSTGTGGSLSRFTIVQLNYLYALSSMSLQIINITAPASPAISASVNVGWDLSSLFTDGNRLFVSSSGSIHIYNTVNPLSPVLISTVSHNSSCSPVIASGNFMYSTNNSANCGNTVNSLQVTDITNLLSPVAVSSYFLNDPSGLGIDPGSGVLAVCDGSSGIRLFSLAGVPYLSQIGTAVPAPSGDLLRDIIFSGTEAFVAGSQGLYIYDIAGIGAGTMNLLATIPIVP